MAVNDLLVELFMALDLLVELSGIFVLVSKCVFVEGLVELLMALELLVGLSEPFVPESKFVFGNGVLVDLFMALELLTKLFEVSVFNSVTATGLVVELFMALELLVVVSVALMLFAKGIRVKFPAFEVLFKVRLL